MKQTSLSAGAIPIRKVDGKWKFLILRAFKYWDFPKGMVEEGEDPLAAALREVEEETGLTKLKTLFNESFVETAPYGKGKVARYYIVEVLEDKPVVLVPNPVTGIIEHHEAKWVSYEEARTFLVPRVQAVIDWSWKYIKSD